MIKWHLEVVTKRSRKLSNSIFKKNELLGVDLHVLAVKQVCNHDFAWCFADRSSNKGLAGHMEVELEEIIQSSDI